jgi:hypothetical protein
MSGIAFNDIEVRRQLSGLVAQGIETSHNGPLYGTRG